MIKHMRVKFTACIDGYPFPSIEWFKNGNKIYNTDRVQMLADETGEFE